MSVSLCAAPTYNYLRPHLYLSLGVCLCVRMYISLCVHVYECCCVCILTPQGTPNNLRTHTHTHTHARTPKEVLCIKVPKKLAFLLGLVKEKSEFFKTHERLLLAPRVSSNLDSRSLQVICWSPCAQRRCYPSGRCTCRPSVNSWLSIKTPLSLPPH